MTHSYRISCFLLFLLLASANLNFSFGEDLPLKDYLDHAQKAVGDPSIGKDIFVKKETGCIPCHTVGGDQRLAGPDLLGIGDKFSKKQIIEAILKPSSSVLAGYATSKFITKKGEVLVGIVQDRSDLSIKLNIADGKLITLPLSEIIKEEGAKGSLMPDGLQAKLSLKEFSDLIAYLKSLKRPDIPEHANASTPKKIKKSKKSIRFEHWLDRPIKFQHPVWFAPIPGQKNQYLVVENTAAKIWLIEKSPNSVKSTLFLDMSPEAHQGTHMGLMGLAFHPNFKNNRRYFLNHHFLENKKFGTYIVERRFSDRVSKDSGQPSSRLLRIDQPTILHTGGMVGFGPDKFLYIGTGDGGPQTDPRGHAQNLKRLNGKILRIDVDKTKPGFPYRIPKSNPLYKETDPGLRKEIFAWGLRQAWRFSWDPLTKDLWVGDVGQVGFEEICIVRKGENHGWNVYEGFVPFSDRYRKKEAVFTPPVLSLGRQHGASVTGGYVYRGKRHPSWHGIYIFCDHESKRVWGMTQKDRKLDKILEIGKAPDRITSFCLDEEGELYALGYDRGYIWRVVLDGVEFE